MGGEWTAETIRSMRRTSLIRSCIKENMPFRGFRVRAPYEIVFAIFFDLKKMAKANKIDVTIRNKRGRMGELATILAKPRVDNIPRWIRDIEKYQRTVLSRLKARQKRYPHLIDFKFLVERNEAVFRAGREAYSMWILQKQQSK
jgi:hypothetical protein